MAERTCSVGKCERTATKRGWCNMHYKRWMKTGDTAGAAPLKVAGRRCSECDAPHEAFGFCTLHLYRWKRGIPLSAEKGTHKGLLDYVKRHTTWKGEGCLIWEYSRDARGYGQINYKGKPTKVSRLMCELIHGPPPFAKAEAAHNCGNGHLGCWHPQHLEWKSHYDNVQDTVRHGRVPRGEKQGGSKLTKAQIAAICRDPRSGASLANALPVSSSQISAIRRGKAWTWTDDHKDQPKRDYYAHARGEKNVQARLTPADVRAIRNRNQSIVDCARRFGVSKKTIIDVRKRRTWKHID